MKKLELAGAITLRIIGVVIGVTVGAWLYRAITMTPTVETTDTTQRNVFISQCKAEATKGEGAVSMSEAQGYCECTLDALLVKYPDLYTDTERLKRWNTEGFGQAETDIIVACGNKYITQ